MDNYERINYLKRKCTRLSTSEVVKVEDLSLRDEEGKTLFEFMVENGASFRSELLEYLTNDYDYLVYMINNDCSIDRYYNIDLLFDDLKGTPIIDILFSKSSHNYRSLPKKVFIHLFEKHSGKYFIEDFLKIDEDRCQDIIKGIDDFDLLYKCLSDIGRLDLFKYANEKCLSHEIANGKTMLDGLLANDVFLGYIDRNSPKLAEILYKNGKYDELLKFDADILIKYPDEKNNYLSLLIEKYQNGENVDFANTYLSSENAKSFATLCLTLARNGIPFRKPSKFALTGSFLDKNKPPIIHMLEMDRDLTIKMFIDDEIIDALRDHIASRFSIEEATLKDLDLDGLLSYLPIGEKLLSNITSGEPIEDKFLYSDDFLKVLDNGETVLEYLFKKKSKIYRTYQPTTVEEIILCVKYKKKLYTGFSEKLLYEKVNDNELLIDFLLKNNQLRIIDGVVRNDLRIIDYCVKYNKFEFLDSSILNELFASINGSYEAEKLLDNDEFISRLRVYDIPMNVVMDILKKGNLKALV